MSRVLFSADSVGKCLLELSPMLSQQWLLPFLPKPKGRNRSTLKDTRWILSVASGDGNFSSYFNSVYQGKMSVIPVSQWYELIKWNILFCLAVSHAAE